MPASSKTIKNKKKKSKPVTGVKKKHGSDSTLLTTSNSHPIFYLGEGENDEFFVPEPKKSPLKLVREWVQKQRFIPQDLSDELVLLFLSSEGYMVDAATDKLKKYFYSRQEPSPLFRNRDPLSCENVNIFKKLYVLPLPGKTYDGSQIICTGLLDYTNYNQMDHAKAFAMVLDLLIWENEFGFGDFVVILDGRCFQCPQLLENKVHNHRSITSLLLDTIPGTLRSLYILYPPLYAKNVADNRNGIWFTVVKSTEELVKHFSSDLLPIQYGGELGHLRDLIEEWNLEMIQNRQFFISFEKSMTNYYRRRLCHEKEVAEGGKSWIYRMKLEADEWEYKIRYYQKMKNFKLLKHPAFGPLRLINRGKISKWIDPLEKLRKQAKIESEEENTKWDCCSLNSGYDKEVQKAESETVLENCNPVLELHLYYS